MVETMRLNTEDNETLVTQDFKPRDRALFRPHLDPRVLRPKRVQSGIVLRKRPSPMFRIKNKSKIREDSAINLEKSVSAICT